jgi:hypothetical protein
MLLTMLLTMLRDVLAAARSPGAVAWALTGSADRMKHLY